MSWILLLLLGLTNNIQSVTVECADETICSCSNLGPTEPCNFLCTYETAACMYSTLYCSEGHPCSIACNGERSCEGIIFVANKATDVSIICGTINTNGCTNAQFDCGTGSCSIDCQGSCEGTSINIQPETKQFTCSSGCPTTLNNAVFSSISPTTTTLQPTLALSTNNPSSNLISQPTNNLSITSFKVAHLKPSSLSRLSGISVTTGPGTTTLNDKWNINVVTQQGSDLTISLNEEWSFDPIHPSSIQLYMQGMTSNSSYDHDGEIVFVFNVNDQYFAQVISLDTRKTAYKECPNSNTPLITRDINDMINSLLPDRYHRFCKNPSGTPINDGIDYWNNVASVYKQPAKWPMWITILNNPTTDTISYRWTDSIAGINLVSSRYTGTFNTNQGLNMHISGESPYEQFFIFSIDVTYRIYIPQPTNNPTLSPTNNPTFPPVKNPTNVPTKIPTFIPTKFPTNVPTK
eukprot:373197_1